MELRNKPAKLSTLEAAKRFADRCIKAHEIILGCDGMFWVVCFADAQKMVKAGYEIIN